MDNVAAQMALLGVLVPLVVSVATFLFAGGWRRFTRHARPPGDYAAALALAAGYTAGHYGIYGWTRFPPVDVIHWLPLLALVVGFAAGFDFPSRPLLQLPVLWVVAAAGMSLLLLPYVRSRWAPGYSAAVLAGGGVALALLAGLARASVARVQSALPILSVVVVCATGVSITLLLSHSALLAQVTGSLAAAAGGLWLLALLFFRGTAFWGSALQVLVLQTGFLCFAGMAYADLELAPTAILMVASQSMWAHRLINKAGHPDLPVYHWRLWAAPLIALVSAVTAAGWVQWHLPEPSPDDIYY